MSDVQLSILKSEWVTLQTQFDSFEKYSLGIKLVSILAWCFLIFSVDAGMWTISVIAILWLQDGIWKTFQNRIGQRLEVVEQAIKDNLITPQNNNTELGMQFNLAWSQNRLGAKGLIGEYVKQSLKPTVAYPHVALIVLALIKFYVS
jgi:hypothetical protein